MLKRKNLLRILTVLLVLTMVSSMFFTLGTSATDGTYYGSSPSINRYEGDFTTDYQEQFNSNVIFKLPDTVLAHDRISLIIEMPTMTLLEAYDNSVKDVSFTDYISTDSANEVKDVIRNDILSYKKMLDDAKVDYTLGETYDTVLSGFEITIFASEFETVCQTLYGKATVIVGEEYEECKTELVENNVNVYETGIFNSSEFGYDGEGTVVAVLDTGLDYYHSAFSTGNFTADRGNLALYFEDIAGILNTSGTRAEEMQSGLTASDVYISEKVPFGFDYADGDSDVFPLLSNHGTHVAGVIAGKDDVITGVAPNAQLVIMKIFSDVEATARTSRILAALEDCVALGVDVINMSIGTGCGFSRQTDTEAMNGVYDRIRERGISLVVAASNSFNSTYGSEKNGNLGLTSNPDSATVGSPSTYLGALSVASINGAKTAYLSYLGNIVYFNESTDRVSKEKDFVADLLDEGQNELEIGYVTIPGAGRTADYTGFDVRGKIVLVKRGYTTFEEKVNIAEQMGAAGIIIYNNVSGDIKMNVGEAQIPACSISQDDGEVLAAAKSGTIKISRSQTSGPFMSDFSSWGPTPDLKIKPEITAHGGSILSSVPGQSYDRISGTSMASPNVAGVAAILRQYVKESSYFAHIKNGDVYDTVELTAIVNRLMMSTADIVLNKNGLPYAVRKQGAGLVNLANTKNTTAYILTYNLVDDGNGNKVYDLENVMDKSKIELGDDPAKTGVYELVFSVENFGNTNLTYNVSASVLTEGVSDTKTSHGETTVTETAYALSGATTVVTAVTGGTQSGNTITVAAGTTATVTVKITLSDADKKYLNDSFENGMYVEGFVMLDAEGETIDLSVPYLAFYGDWTVSPLFDLDYFQTNKDELDNSIDVADKTLPDAYATRPIGGATGDYMSYLGSYYFVQDPSKTTIAADRKYIAISNQDGTINSLKYVWAGMLRGAERIEITITEDSTGEVVFTRVENNIRKAYGDGGAISPANIDIDFGATEYNLKNNTSYTVSLKGYLDYGDGGADTNLNNEFTFPLVTDFEAPTLTDVEFYTEFDRSTNKTRLYAKMAVYDNHYSMSMQVGCFDGTYPMVSFDKYYTPIYSEYNSTSYVVYELTDCLDEIMEANKYLKLNKIKTGDDICFSVVCYDYALNLSAFEVALPDDFRDFYFEEETVTISPNETYELSPVVYPSTEWAQLITYETNTAGSSVIRIVGNKIIGLAPGKALVTARYTVDGVTIRDTLQIEVLGPGDPGYKKYDKPVADSFTLTGYYVNKAFYQLSVEDRDIGNTGDEMKFGGSYILSMYPSEAVTLRYDLDAYFPADTAVEFETSNDKIVTVDKNGKITAIAEGVASITVKVMMDGKSTYYTKSIDVSVKDPYVLTGPSITHYYGAGNDGVVSIPKSLAVTEIGQFAFSNFDYVMKSDEEILNDPESRESMKMWYIGDSTITRVEIPEGIERIGAYAFANLTALKSIKLPSTLETIDYGAFFGCTSLETIEGLEHVKFINQGAFEGCALKGELKLGNAVAIADYAFANNKKLTSIVLSETTQSVGAYAFANNTEVKTLTIKADFIKLGKYAFSDCSKLEAASINAAVIPEGAFNNCTALKTFTIGKDVQEIAQYAFAKTAIEEFTVADGNKKYQSGTNDYILSEDGKTLLIVAPATAGVFTAPSTVTTIANSAFSGNSNVTKVEMSGVTVVGDFAFSECLALTEVVLGRLTHIGDYAFENTKLDSHVDFSGVSSIGKYAFSGTKITTVTIPDGVNVGDGAFKNCHDLVSVTVGDNVTLGTEAFALDSNNTVYPAPYYEFGELRIYYYEYKSALTSLTIGDNVVIGDRAFLSAASLETITLGEGARIGNGAFLNNTKLKSIDLSKVISIGDSAFSGYIHYEYFDESYSTIASDNDGYYKFRFYASKLEAIDLSSLESLGKEAFAYCDQLVSVVLNPELTVIPEYAFAGCKKLSTINLEKVEDVGAYAFTESSIVNLDISSAKKIGEYAFCESNTIATVTVADGATIGEGAFSYCPALSTLNGDEKVVYFGDYSFACTALTEIDLTAAEYVGSLAFLKERYTPFSVKLGANIADMGDNPFAYCKVAPFASTYTENFNGKDHVYDTDTFDINDNIRIIDGSIYRVVPYGLELITWCGSNEATVADGTVRISDMAFAGSDITKVILPSQLNAIGHKAFYDCNKLILVSFSSYEAPILEEEYDYEYYLNGNSLASIGDYTVIGSSNAVGYEIIFTEGLGFVPYRTYDSLYSASTVFYGANFVDYVGRLDSKLTVVRPTNGKYYDSFVMDQYFGVSIDGKAAADEITLQAIETLKTLPSNAANVKLEDKEVIVAARAAYDKIMSDEQRALVPSELVALLKSCEQMIEDLEYLAGGNNADLGVTPPAEIEENSVKALLIVLIVAVIVLTLIVIALVVLFFIYLKKLKNSVLVKKEEFENEDKHITAYYPLDDEDYLTEAEDTTAEEATATNSESEIVIAEEASDNFEKKVLAKPTVFEDITEGYLPSKSAVLKKRLILIGCGIVAAALIIVALVFAIRNSKQTVYDRYDESGYTLSITFDSNGGSFKGSDSSIVDFYNPANIGEDGLLLLAPDDARRDKNNIMTVTKPGYFLAGWYTERTLIDENDPSLGYTYSGRWNFDTDRFYVDPDEDYTSKESALTLYAAWVPYYNFEIYTTDENNEVILLSTVSAIELTIPQWKENGATLVMDNFPTRDGYTLESVYYYDTMNKVEGTLNAQGNKITITGEWDIATATSKTPTIKLYTTWQEGTRYKIYSAKDLIKYAGASGYYEIYADLDFTGLSWPKAFTEGKFNGKIFGNGHKISGVTFETTTRGSSFSGLFAYLEDGAYIENLTFENITHRIDLSATAKDAVFGLLAGKVEDGAGFRNVKISGSLVFGDSCKELISSSDDFTINKVVGNGSYNGVTVGQITVSKENSENTDFDLSIDGNGKVTVIAGN